jgi:hypothetical protein
MKLLRNVAFAAIVALLLCVSLSGITVAADVSAVLRAGGGASGGAGFIMLTGMNTVVKKTYPKINMTVVPGGWVGNIERVNSGELDLASTSNTLCAMAEKNEAPLDKGYPNVRALMNVQDEMYYFMVVTKDFPADSVEEMIAKKVPVRLCTLSKGSVTEMQHRLALAAAGISWDDISSWGGKVNFVNWGDAVSLIKDGHADMICAAAVGKAGWLMELCTVREMKVLKWGDTLLNKVNERTGSLTKTMPASLYQGVDYALDCPATSGQIIANANLPDEVAYAIVNSMANGVKEYRVQHAALESFTAEGMASNIYLPLHPGALKFYQERGYIK